MSDFTAIGQLVTEARNLLDSIKGGAIRTMQTQFDALKSSIASEWNGIKTKMNNEALAAIGRVDTETVINAMGFTAQNYNSDFMDLFNVTKTGGELNQYPSGMGMFSGTVNGITTEFIRVDSGVEPVLRPNEAKALLDCMGTGRGTKHFRNDFNIMKVTVTDASAFDEQVGLIIPDRIVRSGPTATFMCYYKLQSASGSVSYLGEDTGGNWVRKVSHYSGNAGAYLTVDLVFNNLADGDVLYVAIPTITAGHFPKSKPHGLLWSAKTDLVREIKKHH